LLSWRREVCVCRVRSSENTRPGRWRAHGHRVSFCTACNAEHTAQHQRRERGEEPPKIAQSEVRREASGARARDAQRAREIERAKLSAKRERRAVLTALLASRALRGSARALSLCAELRSISRVLAALLASGLAALRGSARALSLCAELCSLYLRGAQRGESRSAKRSKEGARSVVKQAEERARRMQT